MDKGFIDEKIMTQIISLIEAMKRLLLPLIAALALPTVVNSEDNAFATKLLAFYADSFSDELDRQTTETKFLNLLA